MTGILRARLAGAALVAGCCLAAGAAAQAPPAAAPGTAVGASRQPPESIEALWSQGERAYRAGDLEAALRFFEAALNRDERRARSWNYVGGVHFARGDLSRALAHFQRAFELDPRDVRVCNNLGTVRERLGEPALAEQLYLQAVGLEPTYPESHRNLGVLYARRLGRPEDARRAWGRFLELVPSGPDAEAVRRELAALSPPPAPATPP
jgi:tetratricopeptide (TPR) repeat protein